jgi:hypothetical protein
MLTTTRLYEQAVNGEPLLRTTHRPIIDTQPSIWRVGECAYDVPKSEPRPLPEATRLLVLIRDHTGWSLRQISGILGVSHTTVRRIADGGQPDPAHSGDLPSRLRSAYDVVDRVYLLTRRNPVSTARILGEARPGRRSSADELRAGNAAAAYLAAVDALRPPRPSGLLGGDRPRSGDATASLHE